MTSLIECSHVHKQFVQGSEIVTVLDDINLSINTQDSIAIVGNSGSGKSTLLSLIGGLDMPTSGKVKVNGDDLSSYNEQQLREMRNFKIGFVYQFHHLLREFTALENVAMPLLIRGLKAKDAHAAATDMLVEVGLHHRITHKPAQLSGGERQRVAIARALVPRPVCILMDEPTGNLDQHTAEHIHQLIEQLNTKYDTAFVVVTHDINFANKMDKIWQLKDGKLLV